MGNCIVIVQFDLPKRTEEQAVKGGTASAPIYRNLAAKGLIRKDYLNGDAGTGGVYLWDSRASAEAWYTQARIAELTERFGARPRLTWYDTHVTVDNLARRRASTARRSPTRSESWVLLPGPVTGVGDHRQPHRRHSAQLADAGTAGHHAGATAGTAACRTILYAPGRRGEPAVGEDR